MFEFKASELKILDVYTEDDGETWWRVISIDPEPPSAVRVYAQCTSSQNSEASAGDYCSYVYDCDLVLTVK